MAEHEPYRTADETPLEALVRRGTLHAPIATVAVGRRIAAWWALLLVAAWPLSHVVGVGAGLFVLVAGVGGAWWLRRGAPTWSTYLRFLSARSPVPVDNIQWWFHRPDDAVVVDFVLRQPSALAERAIRMVARTAAVAPGVGCMRVAWSLGVEERSMHLVHALANLLPHHQELGLERVRITFHPAPFVAIP